MMLAAGIFLLKLSNQGLSHGIFNLHCVNCMCEPTEIMIHVHRVRKVDIGKGKFLEYFVEGVHDTFLIEIIVDQSLRSVLSNQTEDPM